MLHSYTVEHHEHGILVRGEPVPINVLSGIGALATELGFDQMAPGVASATHALFAFTSTKSTPLWMAELREQSGQRPGVTPLQAWFGGPDVGISSQTIAYVLSGGAIPAPRFGVDVPSDAGDFGRCLCLVRAVDGYRERLDELANRYPAWVSIVAKWDELATLFDAGDYETIYEILH